MDPRPAGGGTSDTLMALFSATPDENLKVRYLTLLSFSDDPVATPFLAAVYESPDSAGIPPRAATRASDALIWIGTKQSLRGADRGAGIARTRGVYAAPALSRDGYTFLENDSSAVISRTGRWLTDWIGGAEALAVTPRVGGSVSRGSSVQFPCEMPPETMNASTSDGFASSFVTRSAGTTMVWPAKL